MTGSHGLPTGISTKQCSLIWLHLYLFVYHTPNERAYLLWVGAGVDGKGARLRGAAEEVVGFEYAAGLAGYSIARVDYLHAITRCFAQERQQERVVGAPQDDGVSALLYHRPDSIAHGGTGLFAAHISTLDRFHETRRSYLDDLHARGHGEALDYVAQEIAPHRRGGRHHTDYTGTSALDRGLDGWDEAHDRHVAQGAQVLKSRRRCGVAGHNDDLGPTLQ